ncbi:MAG: nucleoside triphosphate pyrophosphohydrolase [Bacteroidales bacterium]|nr:nucleoside triphosphate pyrophosphohydrolase [Bacteroidales bacterium]MDE7072172.1 nucleoside triphosphate pyrophosphohydrolase [Bacteroidales bacterium]
MYLLIVGVAVAYLIGSFSSAVWIGRWFFNKDVRQYGSHNAGTTNTIRVLGLAPGIVVLIIDAFKGWLAVKMDFIFIPESMLQYRVYFDVVLAIAVLLGHVFPLYTGFKGGKGVATLLGVVMAVYPEAFVAALLIFAVIFILTRYVSLASIVSAAAFPFLEIFLFRQTEPTLRYFSIFIGLFILITHRKNIGRLLHGKESKLRLKHGKESAGEMPELNAAVTPQEGIERLIKILERLRVGCPWDRKQTFETLRTLTVEETFELSDALVAKNDAAIKEELGDVLLHIAFYAQIGKEENRFDFTDVCNGICEKLIRRHPHIFADVQADTDEEVKKNWEAIKLKEGRKHSVLSGVPSSMPAMIKAFRIQDKAKGVGFDWENAEQVWAKVGEELNELREEVKKTQEMAASSEAALAAQKTKTMAELGDVFFALINYARFIGLNPEDALEHTNRKFIRRFSYMEEQTIQKGKSLHDMSLDEMNVYWEEAKKKEL